MLGAIEELEKDIELFQKNVAASGELVQLLKQLIERIRQQNNELDEKTQMLLSRVDEMPSVIERANSSSNTQIRGDVASELEKAIQKLSLEQAKYIQGLEETKQQINNNIEHIEAQEKSSIDRVSALMMKVDGIPASVEAENIKSNTVVKNDVAMVVNAAVLDFGKEQEKYVSALKQTQEHIEKCEIQLKEKYTEFVECLERMNISNLYEQNLQLKNALDKRTLILMIISGLSLVIGIVGLFI